MPRLTPCTSYIAFDQMNSSPVWVKARMLPNPSVRMEPMRRL